MRILSLTTLYPNGASPTHGVFVENRLRALMNTCDAEVRVIAPVPFFPFKHSVFGRYSEFSRAPYIEHRHGIEVHHPRYLIPPKIGMTYAVTALERCFLKSARALIEEGWDFDIIDAHYFYPDGVATARIAEKLGKPITITARGTDINLIPKFPRQRSMILEAARKADASITVARALKEEMVRIGAVAEKIEVLRNGVDLETFQPLDRQSIRNRMKLSGPVITSVGHLIERKGHHLVIEALSGIPDATLLIAGKGNALPALKERAAALGLENRVRFLGAVPHEGLADIYNAADVLALASSREGWPNVLLEAMACGTPCVATPVWGSSEIITTPVSGTLAPERSAGAIAKAIRAVLENPPDRTATRTYAEKFSWNETAHGLHALFQRIIEKRNRADAYKIHPAAPSKRKFPKLVVTVDTEEAFDWSTFSAEEHLVHSPSDVNRFQALCENFGAKPLYLITYPLLRDPENVAYFHSLRARGKADTGIHLHAWTTPPFDGLGGEFYSYQSNLPVEVHQQKLNTLAELYDSAFGESARAHRAGRYGLKLLDYSLLSTVGIDFDFSPSVGFDFSASGGPNESIRSNHPMTVECPDGNKITIIPVSGAHAVRHTQVFLTQERSSANHFRRWTEPVRLSPEGANFAELKALTKRLIKDEVPVLTYTLHSSSLTSGANAYAPDAAGVNRILETTRQFFDWFTKELDGAFVSLDDLEEDYRGKTPISILNDPLSNVA